MNNHQPGLADAQPEGPAGRPPIGTRDQASTLVITDLLHTSRDLSEALTPVSLRASFRQELHDELILAAQRRSVQRILAGDLADERVSRAAMLTSRAGFGSIGGYSPSRRVVWSAAAVGLGSAVSVIGVMAAYYWRRRGRRPEIESSDMLEETRKAA